MAITPYLYYKDVAAAMKFLARAFGFERTGEQVKGPDGRITHAAMQLGSGIVMMGCPGPRYRNPKQLGRTTQCLYVNVEDVDEHHARARKAGAKVIEEPVDTEYGHRRYGAEDPEGHAWYFAHEIRRRKTEKKKSG